MSKNKKYFSMLKSTLFPGNFSENSVFFLMVRIF